MTVMSKSEFAARRGWSKSYVSKLASQDRLVLTPDGKVELEATEALLAQSADPSKAAVAARHEDERIQRGVRDHVAPLADTSPALPALQVAGGQGADFQRARAHREYYLAQLAETEFLKVQGALVEASTVRMAAFDAGRMLRDALLGLPAQIAGELASLTDPWEIERNLTTALRRVLDDTERLATADLNKSLTTSD
ncbi:terminase small subunit [Pseudomonas sp. 21LCFQ02]|uniref:terminase small subunit n=1 Tax=Pseudomonas sp. 21LCFQ02 TaxID=2957505 RepID=UPI00209BA378|nr:terminase small subunit [Pseudomonas sp. 21LCFQ02]MCO8167856.1 terminase small subunit [Pseudomonas sp. 21LCFQ02]